MADEKKPEAKPAPPPSLFSHPDPFVEIVWAFFVLLIILYIINAIASALFSGNLSSSGVGGAILSSLIDFFWKIFPYIKYTVILLSSLLAVWIVYLYQKLSSLRKDEAKLLYYENTEPGKLYNPQWERILRHIESTNESDWRLAILEADIMLGGVLDAMFLPGETMADKLKAVEKSDFRTIDNAWEAHKVRNQVAHDGAAFLLSQHEGKRIIALYQTVFEEFQII